MNNELSISVAMAMTLRLMCILALSVALIHGKNGCCHGNKVGIVPWSTSEV